MTESDEARIAALEAKVAELTTSYAEALGLLARASGQINSLAVAIRGMQHKQNGHGLILP